MSASEHFPCGACKFLKRWCARDCIFAPYFPRHKRRNFANVHKLFGAKTVKKLLQDLPLHQRGDAMTSMIYEAEARMRDPVYGCVGFISSLQQQVTELQNQVAIAKGELVRLNMHRAAVEKANAEIVAAVEKANAEIVAAVGNESSDQVSKYMDQAAGSTVANPNAWSGSTVAIPNSTWDLWDSILFLP